MTDRIDSSINSIARMEENQRVENHSEEYPKTGRACSAFAIIFTFLTEFLLSLNWATFGVIFIHKYNETYSVSFEATSKSISRTYVNSSTKGYFMTEARLTEPCDTYKTTWFEVQEKITSVESSTFTLNDGLLYVCVFIATLKISVMLFKLLRKYRLRYNISYWNLTNNKNMKFAASLFNIFSTVLVMSFCDYVSFNLIWTQGKERMFCRALVKGITTAIISAKMEHTVIKSSPNRSTKMFYPTIQFLAQTVCLFIVSSSDILKYLGNSLAIEKYWYMSDIVVYVFYILTMILSQINICYLRRDCEIEQVTFVEQNCFILRHFYVGVITSVFNELTYATIFIFGPFWTYKQSGLNMAMGELSFCATALFIFHMVLPFLKKDSPKQYMVATASLFGFSIMFFAYGIIICVAKSFGEVDIKSNIFYLLCALGYATLSNNHAFNFRWYYQQKHKSDFDYTEAAAGIVLAILGCYIYKIGDWPNLLEIMIILDVILIILWVLLMALPYEAKLKTTDLEQELLRDQEMREQEVRNQELIEPPLRAELENQNLRVSEPREQELREQELTGQQIEQPVLSSEELGEISNNTQELKKESVVNSEKCQQNKNYMEESKKKETKVKGLKTKEVRINEQQKRERTVASNATPLVGGKKSINKPLRGSPLPRTSLRSSLGPNQQNSPKSRKVTKDQWKN